MVFLPHALHKVAKMTTLAKLMHASTAWWGYTNANERGIIEKLIGRMKLEAS